MARKTRSLRRRRRSVRVRRNPPAMTPARRAFIGRKIRALHRSGKYRKSPIRRAARRARSAVATVFRRRRRSGGGGGIRRMARRARRGVSRYGSAGIAVGGGMMGLKAIFSPNNLKFVGGAIGGTFVANYAASKLVPMLPVSMQGNPFVVAAVKLGASAIAAKVVDRWSRPVAQGMLIGGMIVVANDFIRLYFSKTTTAAATGQYLGGGRGMSQYLGRGPQVNQNVRSIVGPVTPSARTFGGRSVGAIYGNSSAFPADAWSR